MLGFRLGLRGGMSPVLLDRRYDPDAQAFFARANVVDAAVKRRHDRLVRRLKVAALWSPLEFWHGADAGAINDIDGNTPAANNETTRRWINRRGDWSNADQTSAINMPVYLSGGGPNGTPSIRFNGTTSFSSVALRGPIPQPFTVVTFGVDIGAGGEWRHLLCPEDTYYPRILFVSGNPYGTMDSGGSLHLTTHSVSGAHLTAYVFNGAASAGYQSGKTTVAGGIANTGLTGADLLIGARRDGPSEFASGNFSHLMLFKTALSAGQFSALEAIFRDIYGGF